MKHAAVCIDVNVKDPTLIPLDEEVGQVYSAQKALALTVSLLVLHMLSALYFERPGFLAVIVLFFDSLKPIRSRLWRHTIGAASTYSQAMSAAGL